MRSIAPIVGNSNTFTSKQRRLKVIYSQSNEEMKFHKINKKYAVYIPHSSVEDKGRGPDLVLNLDNVRFTPERDRDQKEKEEKIPKKTPKKANFIAFSSSFQNISWPI